MKFLDAKSQTTWLRILRRSRFRLKRKNGGKIAAASRARSLKFRLSVPSSSHSDKKSALPGRHREPDCQ
ncbi:MAG: hypothetical protein ACYC5U_09265 [Rhodocyclaceae bacterium]